MLNSPGSTVIYPAFSTIDTLSMALLVMIYAALFVGVRNAFNYSQSSLLLRFVPEVTTQVASSSTSSTQTSKFFFFLTDCFIAKKSVFRFCLPNSKTRHSGHGIYHTDMRHWIKIKQKSSSMTASLSVSQFCSIWTVIWWRLSLLSVFWRK